MNRIATASAVALALALTTASAPQAAAQSGKQLKQLIPGQQTYQIAAGSYYSPRLRARFLLQYMSIPGFSFWGARIVDLNFDSPLRQLNLQVGDVVTRLDGIRVSNGRYQAHDHQTGTMYWILPQMEKHYGHTHVRFIRTGTTFVQQHAVDLGPLCNGGGGGIGGGPGGGIAP